MQNLTFYLHKLVLLSEKFWFLMGMGKCFIVSMKLLLISGGFGFFMPKDQQLKTNKQIKNPVIILMEEIECIVVKTHLRL